MAAVGLKLISQSVLGRTHNHIRSSIAFQSVSYHKCGLRRASSKAGQVPDFAFAFDIDGVLLRSSDPIPGASEALQFLQSRKIPFILLTNGGGKSEKARVEQISSKLKISLSESMIVQSHTPFAELAKGLQDDGLVDYTSDGNSSHPPGSGPPSSPSLRSSFKDKNILVAGGDHNNCRLVAEKYGFTSVITPGDIFAAHPEIWPFSKVFQEYYSRFAQPLPRPINRSSPEDSLKIDAVFIYNDPRDWALDIQLILDILLSRSGILGTYSEKNGDESLPNKGYQQDGQPPLYFSNPDLLWAASYHLNRLGQGGFREALEGVWAAVTGGAKLEKIVIGKPHQETYEFAERKLLRHRHTLLDELLPISSSSSSSSTGDSRNTAQEGSSSQFNLKRVYMVGDNPESDIAGANNYKSSAGIQWKSLLTRTGVWRDGHGKVPSHKPTAIVDDVREAVRWALRDNGWDDRI